MRVLLDENLPLDLAPLLEGHQVDTIIGLGWCGLTNGEVLDRARGRFDAFVTMDRNIEHQQQLRALPFAVVLVRAPSNRMVHLRPLVPALLAALTGVQPGELRWVGA